MIIDVVVVVVDGIFEDVGRTSSRLSEGQQSTLRVELTLCSKLSSQWGCTIEFAIKGVDGQRGSAVQVFQINFAGWWVYQDVSVLQQHTTVIVDLCGSAECKMQIYSPSKFHVEHRDGQSIGRC